MTPFEVKVIAAALVALVVLMWALTLIEFGWRGRTRRTAAGRERMKPAGSIFQRAVFSMASALGSGRQH